MPRSTGASSDQWVHAAVHLLRAGKAENDGDIETMGAELGGRRAEFELVGDAYGLAMSMFIESAGRLMLASDLEGAEKALGSARDALERLGPETAAGMLDCGWPTCDCAVGDFEGAREFARTRSRG